MNPNLVTYYSQRASEYEKIYQKPERQNDLQQLSRWLQRCFSGKDLLEIACGTGYWTERIAQTASSILATDINESVINIARTKDYHQTEVNFKTVDLYKLDAAMGKNHLFAGFLWSHIPIQDLGRFLDLVLSLVPVGGTAVFIDNQFVMGSNLPIIQTDNHGNTYQTRYLEDGTAHLILKNFPTESFLHTICQSKVSTMEYYPLEYYWGLKCVK
ncbi:MAG: class I SAM-dependent methyltransferase [Chitinophagales bacterium]|nr:class I SAM-dependent methyltransferase [Chitinophagales bacterium]